MKKITQFGDEDLLNLEEFAERLEKFINVEHNYIEDSLVISLNSKFGSGKSTFLQMWKNRLENKPNSLDLPPKIIMINAWESDYYGDPLFSLISALSSFLKNDPTKANQLIDAVKNVGWFAISAGSQMSKKFTGIDPVASGDLAEKKKIQREGQDAFYANSFLKFEERKNAMTILKKTIKELFGQDDQRTFILVDELDRCRPDYSISFLETIKHIFDIKGIVFIIAVDRKQLESSAIAAFGEGLDFPEYYRKFVHREVNLPQPDENSYKSLSQTYVDYYLQRDNERYCMMNVDKRNIQNITSLITAFKLTPRQIQEIFRILGHSFETNRDDKGKIKWTLASGTILMSILRIAEPQIYEDLGNQKLNFKIAGEFFHNLLGESYPDWWFALCLTGNGFDPIDTQSKSTEEIFQETPFKDSRFSNNLRGWYDNWPTIYDTDNKNQFARIKTNIEEIVSWN